MQGDWTDHNPRAGYRGYGGYRHYGYRGYGYRGYGYRAYRPGYGVSAAKSAGARCGAQGTFVVDGYIET